MSVGFARTARWRRRWRSGLAAAAVVAVVGGLLTVATTPASAATVDTSAWYVLLNRNSGKAMDVSSFSTADGAADPPVDPSRRSQPAVAVRGLRRRLLPVEVEELRQGPRRGQLVDRRWREGPAVDGPQRNEPAVPAGRLRQRLRQADRPEQRQGRRSPERLDRRRRQHRAVRRLGRQQPAVATRPGGWGHGTGAGPCDIYGAGGTPCVAAHSTTRALYRAYNGNLYQVRRSDNTTRNIGVLTPGGVANAAAQDSFCANTTCVITVLFDQSGRGNDLWYQGSSVVPGSPQMRPAVATTESLTVGGSKAYSLYINPGTSYWRDGHLTGVPTGSEPEGMYMVTSGTHVNSGCCFDYGNSETTRKADGPGAMDAIYFGTSCWFGGCSGSGPWVQADLEWGLFPGGSSTWNPNQQAFTSKFVTATLKNNGTSRFAIKGSNAQAGSLNTLWDGALPNEPNVYSPMKKQGAIVLGSGGDCCSPEVGNTNDSAGTFYEGAMVSGYPSDATENAVQANIVAAGYR